MSPVAEFVRPLVLSGPSGAGKSTLLKRLLAEYPDRFGFSVSHTTRSPRAGEEDGVAYHFVPREKFTALIAQDAFIEHAEYSGNMYGTSYATVEDVSKSGRRCILDIDSQGVKTLKKSTLKPFYLFVAPPTLTDLRQRLKGRGTETNDVVEKRMKAALTEVEYAQQSGIYDAVVVNDELHRAYEVFRKIALGEQTSGDAMPSLKT